LVCQPGLARTASAGNRHQHRLGPRDGALS
jgi:hypothetical protein